MVYSLARGTFEISIALREIITQREACAVYALESRRANDNKRRNDVNTAAGRAPASKVGAKRERKQERYHEIFGALESKPNILVSASQIDKYPLT